MWKNLLISTQLFLKMPFSVIFSPIQQHSLKINILHHLGLKVGSPRSNRVNVHHAVPLDILHRTSNRNSADHSILINNRLILSATNTASTTKSPSSTTSNSSSKQAQAIRKTVFYNTDEGMHHAH